MGQSGERLFALGKVSGKTAVLWDS